MSISSIGGSTRFDPAQMAQKFFKKADVNRDGGVDKSELKAVLANGPGKSNGTRDIDKIFAQVDTDGNGKIDESENANQMKKMATQGGPPPGSTGGAPPGGGGAPKAAASSGSSSSSNSKVYDVKDTNKDGTVSFQEELTYNQEHPEEVEDNPSANATNIQQNSTGYNKLGNRDAGTSGMQSSFSLNA